MGSSTFFDFYQLCKTRGRQLCTLSTHKHSASPTIIEINYELSIADAINGSFGDALSLADVHDTADVITIADALDNSIAFANTITIADTIYDSIIIADAIYYSIAIANFSCNYSEVFKESYNIFYWGSSWR